MLNKLCNRNKCTCWFDGNWGECCEVHDIDYIHNPDNITRLEADKKLFNCVRKNGGIIMASIMFVGVRAFGSFFKRK